MKLATDYVIEGNYRLIDLDGEPTFFGRWDDLAVAVDGIDGCPDKHPLEACFNSYGRLRAKDLLRAFLDCSDQGLSYGMHQTSWRAASASPRR